jgi:hypothetical protein
VKYGRVSSESGGADQIEAERIACDEALKERLIHARQILTDFAERVLRGRSELHGRVVGDPIQIDQHGGLLALREHRGEVDGQRRRSDAALDAEKCVDLAEFAGRGAAGRALGRLFQPGNCVAELDAFERLKQEVVGSGAHGRDHRLAVGMIIRGDHIEVGNGLLGLFERLERRFLIRGEIEHESRFGRALEILHQADVEVGRDLGILADDLRVLYIKQILANHLAEVLIGRSYQ